jgi:hypothetical protein
VSTPPQRQLDDVAAVAPLAEPALVELLASPRRRVQAKSLLRFLNRVIVDWPSIGREGKER